MKPHRFNTLIVVLVMAALSALGMSSVVQATQISGDFGPPPIVGEGESLTVYAPHHFDATPPHPPSPHPMSGGGTHYFAETGDLHHFAWFSTTPATPGPITIKYDFRAEGGFMNLITMGQRARAVDALSAWSAATIGKVVFVQDTVAPAADIINIGTGDLAALGDMSGPGGTLGLGGGFFSHGATTHSITGGVAWQDSAETWDVTIGNGNLMGTFDYFTVVTQEIGHALGLGHTDNTGSLNMMNGTYTTEQTGLTTIDISHMQSVHGATIPEPGTLLLVVSGLGGLGAWQARRRRRSVA